jgi:HSP20 family protein
MKKNPDILRRLLEERLGAIRCEFEQIQLSSYRAKDFWRPPINAYRCRDGFVICCDLAGVGRQDIEVQVEPKRLLIRGRRQLPGAEEKAGPLKHVLAMEIDHGQFEREVVLSVEIDPKGVRAEQCNGLLWITLPLSSKT